MSTTPINSTTNSGQARDHSLVVNIERVTKVFHFGQTQVAALKEIELKLYAGDFTALIGPSGAGKSTLMNIIGCIDTPSSGNVTINGVNVLKLSKRGRAVLRNREIGIVFQSFNLVSVLSVEENVELPLLLRNDLDRTARKRLVAAMLDQIGIASLARAKPEKLSGGQRQRIAIARALINTPKLVIADEPTANLDSVTAHQIIDLMLALNASLNVTFLLSTHDEKLIGRVRRVVAIKDGRIAI